MKISANGKVAASQPATCCLCVICAQGSIVCVRVCMLGAQNPLLAVLQTAPKSQLHQTSLVFARLKPNEKKINAFDLVDRAAFYGRRATLHNCTHFLLTQFHGDNTTSMPRPQFRDTTAVRG